MKKTKQRPFHQEDIQTPSKHEKLPNNINNQRNVK